MSRARLGERGALAGDARLDCRSRAREDGAREITNMTLCPIALAVGCRKCPAFSVCPLKTVIGDHKKAAEGAPPPPSEGAK